METQEFTERTHHNHPDFGQEHAGHHHGKRHCGHSKNPFVRGHRFRHGGFGPHGFGGPGFGPGFGAGFGPGGARGRRARKGDVRMAILSVLNDGPQNGYSLIRAIAEQSGGSWRVSPGSVYPTLTALEAEGLILGNGKDRRTEYTLSDSGKQYIADHEEEISQIWAASSQEAEELQELRSSVTKLMGAIQQISMDGNKEQLQSVTESLNDTRRKIYKLLSE